MARGWRHMLTMRPEVEADLGRRARSVKAAAGDGYEVDERRGRNRDRAQVRTATYDAMRTEAETRRLTRALDAARR